MSLDDVPIRDNQLSKTSQTSLSFLGITTNAVTGYRYAWSRGLWATFYAELGRVPDELLQRLIVILCKEKTLGLFNDITEVLQDRLAFGGEVFIGVG